MTRSILIVGLLVVLLGTMLLWLGDTGARTEGAEAPDAAAATSAAPDMAAPAAPAESAAENSFIVCPGDPRCP